MKNKLLKTIFTTPVVLAPTLSLCSCFGKRIEPIYYELKDSMLSYFKEWCTKPHPTYYFGPINKWLTESMQAKGYTVYRDDYYKNQAQQEWPSEYKDYYGNIWFDVPASEGFEDYPLTVLQCHMDMVIDGMSLEDAKTTPIEPEINEKKNIITSKDQKTSLGADDGAGGCMVLALIDNPKVKHGPLRVIYTADEEDGLLGAKVIGQYDDSSSVDVVKDAKYFINVDGEKLGGVVNSSGGIRYFWYRLKDGDESKITTVDDNTNIVTLKCNGVRGGHSAGNIIKHANALKCLLDVIDEAGLATVDNNFQLISATTDTNVVNTIPTDVEIKFAISESFDIEQINNAIQTTLSKWKKLCPDDKSISIEMNYDKKSSSIKGLTKEFSKNLFDFMSWFEFGVIDWLKEGETPASSQNIGPFNLDANKSNITEVLQFGSSSRSCYEEKLEEFEQANKNKADEYLGEGHYELFGEAPPYSPAEINPMRDIIMDGFKHYGTKCWLYDEHGGLEVSYFAQGHENLHVTSIGPTIMDCHNKKETLYLNTVIPTFQAIVYALPKLK